MIKIIGLDYLNIFEMQYLKQKVIDLIKKLPENVDYNDIFEAIYFQQKIEIGLRELEEGKGISDGEARERFKKWLK
ncbi:MAG: hypothetical protein GF317_06915 [Candidatus Lokiarchaeota archaeon]|nr:hypothetical protein [Candidatus Lokiarchaeota archaeon]MBD3199440.1 hypothetical protein [Candidatus Lokiarchaeota archaeon]